MGTASEKQKQKKKKLIVEHLQLFLEMKHFIHFATNIQPVNMTQSIHRRSEFKVIHLQHHASTILHSPFLKLEADYKVQGKAFVPKHPTSGLSNPAPGGTRSCKLLM